jgi:F-type H+-transporting ATPase subunit delta
MRRFARPFAEALLSAAGSTEAAVEARDRLRRFAEAMDLEPRLAKVAANPAIPLATKTSIVDAVAEELGLDALGRRFLHALATRYKLARLAEILEGVDELLNRRLGIVVAEVEVAQALSSDEQDRLRETLEQKLDRKVELEVTVHPELLAGFVVKTGSELFDASVRGQLTRLTQQLAGARVP